MHSGEHWMIQSCGVLLGNNKMCSKPLTCIYHTMQQKEAVRLQHLGTYLSLSQ